MTLELPAQVTPLEYQTELTLDPREPKFSGRQRIAIQVRQSENDLFLHASQLTIKRVAVSQNSSELTGVAMYQQPGLLKLSLPRKLNMGHAMIEIDFEGMISQLGHQGLYHSRSGANDYIFSQFEPISARSAFPCFDQPDYKLPWQLTLHVPSTYQAYSNTNPESESREEVDGKVIRFRKTRPIPAYLVALAVGRFTELPAGKTRSGAPMRLIVPKGDEQIAATAASDVQPIEHLVEDYFGVRYPYEKLDHLVTPDSKPHAEENAGLIIYDASRMLVQPGEDTRERQIARGGALAHEMAHQWTGDLVTMRWWDDLWLKESMATWMANKMIEHWRPELSADTPALTAKQEAIDVDRLLSAHQVHHPVISEGDLTNAYDRITYQKGASVFRMAEAQAGEQPFQKGVQLYLRRFAFATASESDFLIALREGAGQNLAKTFHSFLNQPGVPVVDVRLDCHQTSSVHVEQHRFLQLNSAPASSQVWNIPICLNWPSRAAVQTCFVLSERSANFPLPKSAGCPAFVQANKDELGYYLPVYSPDQQKSLTASAGQLTIREQKGLLFSQKNLFEEGQVSAADLLELVQQYARSQKPALQIVALNAAETLTGTYIAPDLEPKVAAFVNDAFGPQAVRLGWTPRAGESAEAENTRQKLLLFVAQVGRNQELRREATSLARRWVADRNLLDSRTRRPILATAAIQGDKDLFESYLSAFRAPHDREESTDVLYALGSFEDPDLHERALSLMLNELGMMETYPLVQGSFSDSRLRPMFFPFLEQHYNELLARMPRDRGQDFALAMFDTGTVLCSSGQLESFNNFFRERTKQIPGGEEALARTTEVIRGCIARRAALTPGLQEYLSRR